MVSPHLHLHVICSSTDQLPPRKIWHDPVHTRNPEKESANLRECFKYLEMTSRSFSSVIQELNPELLVPVALFYLILRGLDTIEDDMTIPLETKEPKLRNFQDILEEDGWTFNENGPNEKDRELLVHFDVVIAEFKLVKPAYRDIIKDITLFIQLLKQIEIIKLCCFFFDFTYNF